MYQKHAEQHLHWWPGDSSKILLLIFLIFIFNRCSQWWDFER